MHYENGAPVYASPEAKNFPHLDELLGAYFHQDFDLFGNTLQEILSTYRDDSSREEQQATRDDITRFLAGHGPDDAAVADALERTFKPGVIIDGWEGMNAKQWLEEVARLLA